MSKNEKELVDRMLALYTSENDALQELISSVLDRIDSSKLKALKDAISAKNNYYTLHEEEADSVDSLVFMLASFCMSRLAEANLRKLQLQYETE